MLMLGPPEEIAVIKEMFRLYSKEKRSFPYIAGKLNDLGSPHGSGLGCIKPLGRLF
jgi:hypothetical protein